MDYVKIDALTTTHYYSLLLTTTHYYSLLLTSTHYYYYVRTTCSNCRLESECESRCNSILYDGGTKPFPPHRLARYLLLCPDAAVFPCIVYNIALRSCAAGS